MWTVLYCKEAKGNYPTKETFDMEFYDEDKSTLLIFTIYDNGSCCLGREYEEFYTVEDGRQKYIDLCEFYEAYDD